MLQLATILWAAVWPSGLRRSTSHPLAGRSWVRIPVHPTLFSVWWQCFWLSLTVCGGFLRVLRFPPPIESQLAITSVPSEVRQWPAKALYDRCNINASFLDGVPLARLLPQCALFLRFPIQFIRLPTALGLTTFNILHVRSLIHYSVDTYPWHHWPSWK